MEIPSTLLYNPKPNPNLHSGNNFFNQKKMVEEGTMETKLTFFDNTHSLK